MTRCSVGGCWREADYYVGARAVCEAHVRSVPDDDGCGAVPVAAVAAAAVTMRLKVQCPQCLDIREVELPYAPGDYEARRRRWRGGVLVQRAFPELTAEQREAIQTGTCAACWNRMFDEAPF